MVDPVRSARLLWSMTPTMLHADFSVPVALQTDTLDWLPSPAPGVERRMLDRIGGEVARATSIVRYAPNSRFDRHVHGAGEEFLVLDGTFSDEHGDYPRGMYVRNPWNSAHSPYTEEGCTIFVKLRQMDSADQRRVVVQADGPADGSGPGLGMHRKLLHAFRSEVVTFESWGDGAGPEPAALTGGAELLVVYGTLVEGDARYTAGSWVRYPPGARFQPVAHGPTRFWMKRGHLLGVSADT